MAQSRYELHLKNDTAAIRYSGRTAHLSTHRSYTAAAKALNARLASGCCCRSAYEIHEVPA